MGRARRLAGSRRVRIAVNAVFVGGALTAAALTVLHFVHSGWPLASADPLLVVAAGVLFLFAYAFKAWGWQRLFPEGQRPEALTLAAAGGAASVGGVALPGRFDEAIRIAVVRRLPGKKTAGLGAICLTLIVVGLLDSAALAPMASVAAAASHSGGVQVGFALVAAAGVAAAALVLCLPRIARLSFVSRWKVGRWLREHTACPRSASQAWLLISVSWALRGVAVFVLLNALAVGGSFTLALAFLCASAASASLPIAPAGAATQAGAGAAILIVAGIPKGEALAFAVAAQGLIIFVGAIVVAAAGVWALIARFRPARAAILT
ncbi:MAG TPA: lysylphosphatidylglycerol synthase domain-containing protein [Gaiellaceae bacterium]|nr:lysylphosphatidylglycerol synthase domain-containing protein [Gaiellaceae bacterium]